MTVTDTIVQEPVSRIPIRNIWFLLMYALDLTRVAGRLQAEVEELEQDAPLIALIAHLLCGTVARRLRRALTRGYVSRAAVLHRVRGRIDMFETINHRLLESGRVSCVFEEMTVDTPRNRYVNAALVHLATSELPSSLKVRCNQLTRALSNAGVRYERVSPRFLAQEQFGRNDAEDRLMLEMAKLAFDIALPTEVAGSRSMARIERSETWLRRLFERAVAGFYQINLPASENWTVLPSRSLNWNRDGGSPGISLLLPKMVADITIDQDDCRLVIDTKFTDPTQLNRWGKEVFKSAHIYQIYAYLRSQANLGHPKDDHASGMLLYPTLDSEVEEEVIIQGHRIRFATIDLNRNPKNIADRLLQLVDYDAPAK